MSSCTLLGGYKNDMLMLGRHRDRIQPGPLRQRQKSSILPLLAKHMYSENSQISHLPPLPPFCISVALVHFVSGESHIQALYCHLGGGYFTPKCTFLTLAKLGKYPTAIHHLLTNKTCWLPFAMYYKMTKKKKLLVQSDCIVSWRLRPDC